MSQFRVLYTDRGDYTQGFDVEQPIYAALGVEIVDARLDHNALNRDLYAGYLKDADALICHRVIVDRQALDAAPRLRVAVRSGVGYENFDLAAFAERGIPACNVPDYGSEEVAVHALALLMSLARRTSFFDQAIRQGVWRGWAGDIPMRRLSNQTVGIVGLGRIGRAFAARAGALFGRVVACDPYVGPDVFAAAGALPASLDELLAQSDAISLHVPLTRRTKHLIGPRELALMRPTTLLVNTSRGAVVDQFALAAALEAGTLEGAACDVWEREPPDTEHPLFRCANFLGTPHIAGISVESTIDNRTKQAQEVVRVLSGEPPLNPVSPED